jgi:diguanylate cyclase (GGDEF)-like protein/putative nucleotidyltransferase with HDIG domain
MLTKARRRRGEDLNGDHAATSAAWSPVAEEAVHTTRQRHRHALAGRERLVGAPFGIALLLAVLVVGVVVPDPRSLDLLTALALLAAFVLAARVEFQTGAGYAVPTQLVVVPMVFALPVAAVPVVVGTGYVLARALQSPRPSLGVERMIGEFANAWYALAPALVITLAHAERPTLSSWPIYVAALAAQFALDAFTAYLRSSLAFGTRAADLLRELSFAQRLDLTLAPLGFLAALVSRDAELAWLLVLPLLGLISMFGNERTGLIDNQLELARAYRGTALLLGDVVEGDDEYTGRHSRGVGMLAIAVADHLGLDADLRRDVEFGALLHDVGKVAMPKEIINKPGALSDEEWAIMRTHTIEGQRMLQRVGGVLEHIGLVVRGSHERWDGTGYPDGLAGEAIPLASRIVSCVDAFSAITTDRPYRPARTLAEAVTELRACAGTHFDPDVVEAVVAVVERQPHEAPADATAASQRTLDRIAAELMQTITPSLLARRSGGDGTSFRSLIDALQDGIVLFSADGGVQASNAAAQRLLGFSGDELPAALKAGGGLLVLDEDGLPLATAEHPWRLALATGEPSLAVTVGVDGPDGEVMWLGVSSRPLRRHGRKQPHAVVCSLTDITDQRRIEEELRELVDRDPLTGLYTSRRFEEDVRRQIDRSRRYGEQAQLLVVDLGPGGAGAGDPRADELLAGVAQTLRTRLRASDVLGRLGDQQFAAVLAHTTHHEAAQIADELRRTLSAAHMVSDPPPEDPAARIAVAAINPQASGLPELLERADVAPRHEGPPAPTSC